MGGAFGLVIHAAVFFIVTHLFIALFEEPYLEREFGADYADYKRHVRRWIPRVAPGHVPQTPRLTPARSQLLGCSPPGYAL